MPVQVIRAVRPRPGSAQGVQEREGRLQVAAYCRVSTESDEQETSYEAQCRHYTDYINEHPGWELAGIYADEGISGTSMKKREQFNGMLRDCEEGRINMILTKSISRWARNTIDSLKTIRKLRDLGIPVIFEKENINTMDEKGEVLITIMSSLAQQESESISKNVRMGIQYLMQQAGIPCYYCTGYSGENHAWNIIKIGNEYYNVDVTWDDTDPSTYDYFNQSDAQFLRTHVRTGLSVYLPPCGSAAAENTAYEPIGNTVAGITLNPNPQQPLTWTPKENKDEKHSGDFVSGGDVYSLDRAGLTADAVQSSLKDYYANCLKQMVDRGSGQQSFSNVVPKSVLAEIEKAYGTGDYEKGYVNEGLKKLKRDYFAIQIQVQDIGGNYYRLYHNIYTW